MRFPHFWRSRRAVRGHESADGLARSRSWRDSGLADELQAFLGEGCGGRTHGDGQRGRVSVSRFTRGTVGGPGE
jgi:hypothetical protein